MSNINTGGPAFPNASIKTKEVIDVWGEGGMTLRDYFAAKAMQGMVGSTRFAGWVAAMYAKEAYEMADALLKARER